MHSLPYRNMSLLMIDFIVGQEKSMLNALLSKTGIFITMSAKNVIQGRPNLDYNTISIKMGAYVQLFEGTKNPQRVRFVGSVALN